MFKVGIVGGTGYTGVELLRLLLPHPQIELTAITSRSEAGRRLDNLYPNLRGQTDLAFVEPTEDALAGCDLRFLPRLMGWPCPRHLHFWPAASKSWICRRISV